MAKSTLLFVIPEQLPLVSVDGVCTLFASLTAFLTLNSICPGADFAINLVQLFAASMLHVFEIQPGVDEAGNAVTLTSEVFSETITYVSIQISAVAWLLICSSVDLFISRNTLNLALEAQNDSSATLYWTTTRPSSLCKLTRDRPCDGLKL